MSDKRITVWVQRFKDREHLVLQWIDPVTNKPKSKSAETADPDQAEAARCDLESDLNNNRYQEASRLTWEKFRELFEAEYVAPLRPDTRRNYRVTLDLFERVCGPKSLRSVNERTVSTFAAGLRKRPGYGGRDYQLASTIKVRLQFLHTALAWAAEQKLLPACPKFPAIKVPKKKPQPIPAESFERLLEKAPDPQMRAFLLCGWLAGLRLNEALALEWEETKASPWLDLYRNRIILPAEFVKAVEDQWLPLDPKLKEALLVLFRNGKKVFRFVETRSGKPIGDIAISHRITELAQLAGVRLTMKELRKGFGCRYAGKVSAHVLQRLMRHASIKTTMEYYANVDEAIEEAVLGPERNSSRNRDPVREEEAPTSEGANTHQDGTSV